MTTNSRVELSIAVFIGALSASIAIFTIKRISRGADLHAHCALKIKTERNGRINAEKKLRSDLISQISSTGGSGYPMLVIGHVESPFVGRRGTPRQGLLVPSSRSRIVLKKEIPKETLEGLATYSHLFIQFLFHENTNLPKTMASSQLTKRAEAAKSSGFAGRVQSFAARVAPPLLGGSTLGLFATRSPHRPNALGLSLVKIENVDIDNRTVTTSLQDESGLE